MKHRRHGVKREHHMLQELAPALERLAALPEVQAVIPGRIARNTTAHPGLVLKAETAAGFKLLAKTRTSIQEVFVVVASGQRGAALQALRQLTQQGPDRPRHRPGPAAPSPPRAATRSARQSAGRARRSPLLPTGRAQGPLVRWPGGSQALQLGERLAARDTRRRLLAMRLQGAHWRHRLGMPLRRVARQARRRP